MPDFNEYGEIVSGPKKEKEVLYSKEDFSTSNWENSVPYDTQPIPPRPQSASVPSGGVFMSGRLVIGIVTGFVVIVLIFGVLIGLLIANRNEKGGEGLSVISSSESNNSQTADTTVQAQTATVAARLPMTVKTETALAQREQQVAATQTALARAPTNIPESSNTPYLPTNTPRPATNTPKPPKATPTPRPPTSTPLSLPPSLEWIKIPGGNFWMGSNDADLQKTLAECNETEGKETGQACEGGWFKEPQRLVSINDFEISKYEITNAQYNACVMAGICREIDKNIGQTDPPYDPGYFADSYPVVTVSWHDADIFCRQWVGGRLPTEEEWERASRGSDGRRYPWGNSFDYSKANLDTDFPSPVGSFPAGASPYGLMDMAGNVFEWTASWGDFGYLARGGGWTKYYFRGRVTDRGTQLDPSFANYDIGFRCAK